MKQLLLNKQIANYIIDDLATFKAKALQWSKQFRKFALLDNNGHQNNRYQSEECLIAAGAHSELKIAPSSTNAFEQLRTYYDETGDWLFGFLTYDLKNELEQLSSENEDHLAFPSLCFFQPTYLLKVSGQQVAIESWAKAPDQVFEEIQACVPGFEDKITQKDIALQSRISKTEYLQKVEKIREHIIEGDLYEMNFCQEFYATDVALNPWAAYAHLNEISKAPFSVFYRTDDQYLLCASPERFLKKEGRKLISQPIKGTSGRSTDPAVDKILRDRLSTSIKDQAENVMIVDLVRNDLARSCEAGSVKVEELFGIYPFEHVHQMISTVVGQLKADQHPIDALAKAFPMGSMTGAPKVMSMQLIEAYEKSRRGLYSGAVGYFSPEGDFDFNVVIRSILYNASQAYLSFQVGGAIVFDSVPEQEYEECLLKAKGMMQVLGV